MAGSCWQANWKRRGHTVLMPAFDVNRTDEGLVWHAETIVQALDRSGLNPADVVCVAHSASGIYLPLIAERWSPRRMVFLAAVVPRPGTSFIEQFRIDPSMFNPAWVGQNPLDDKVALNFVFHDCPPDRLDWAMSTRIMFYAKRAIEEPARCRPGLACHPPTSSVPTIERSLQRGSVRPLENCSECSRLNCPADTARMLVILRR